MTQTTRRTVTTLALLVTGSLTAYAQSPWERAAANLETSFTGPLARSLALVAIVLGGLMFMFGEGGAKRQISGIVSGWPRPLRRTVPDLAVLTKTKNSRVDATAIRRLRSRPPNNDPAAHGASSRLSLLPCAVPPRRHRESALQPARRSRLPRSRHAGPPHRAAVRHGHARHHAGRHGLTHLGCASRRLTESNQPAFAVVLCPDESDRPRGHEIALAPGHRHHSLRRAVSSSDASLLDDDALTEEQHSATKIRIARTVAPSRARIRAVSYAIERIRQLGGTENRIDLALRHTDTHFLPTSERVFGGIDRVFRCHEWPDDTGEAIN